MKRVMHLRRAPGAVGIGLPDGNIPGDQAIRIHVDFVVADFRARRVAQRPRMNEGEVSHVQKILDDAGAHCSVEIRAGRYLSERRIVPFGERRNVLGGLAERHPH